jgi:hypothetical protein
MKNTDRIPTAESAVARVPAFAVTPPVRCFSSVGGPQSRKCGELATKRRRGGRWFSDSFHCDQHAESTDVDLSGEFVVRRVRVSCDVLLAGVDERGDVAQGEAVARLEAAIRLAGGVLEVSKAGSTVGRYPAHAGRCEFLATLGSRE